MTYRELDLYSNRVANELHRRELKREEPVVILLPASCEFLVSIMGVLKAGGTYLPVDTDTPAKRLEFILKDSTARFVLSNAANKDRLDGWSGQMLDAHSFTQSSAAADEKYLDVISDPNRRAYIMYTSGSTGQPKGVEIEHHALTNFVCCYQQYLKITVQDRTSLLAYVAFDVSVADIWPTLCAGGVLAIPPKGILLNPDALINWLATEEITVSFVPTGLAEILFVRPWPTPIKLRVFVTGGDRLRLRPPAGLPFMVLNGYGPTEATVFSTWSVVAPENGSGQTPPIGRPLGNTTAYVLDEQLEPLPVEVAGELYLGGEQLARGYIGRPDLTAELFLPDPFAGKPGARMYRTGDWVRWLPDGELEFLGRKDGQIQIRGRRVELGEIEANLFAHAAVRQVCCVPLFDDGMPAGVIAHIVPEIHGENISDQLRAYLQAHLPDYMVPAEFILHESLPLTPQGKLDRGALTNLKSARKAASPSLSSGDELTKSLAQLWHSLLPAAGQAPDNATFQILGGDSLLTIRLMLGVEKITGQKLEPSTFLVEPTFAGLCRAVRARRLRTDFEAVVTIRKTGTRPPLFFLYNITGDVEAYFDLAKALGEDQPVIGIRSPALEDLSRLPTSIEAAAAEVIRCIRKVQPHGAPMLAGYSWAGMLAFEVARQLEQTEGIQCFTALIGPDTPLRPTDIFFRLTHFARYFPSWLWRLVADQENRTRRLGRWREMIRGTKKNLVEASQSAQPLPDWANSPIARHLIGLGEKFRPFPKCKTSVDIFRERDEFHPPVHPLEIWQTSSLPDAGWSYWTLKPNRIHWLPGDHITILKPPAVSGLAQAIRAAMDRQMKSARNPLANGVLPMMFPVSIGCFFQQLTDLAAFSIC